MSSINAVHLIIENIQLLEQSKKILEGEVTEVFLNAVDEVIKDAVDGFNDEMLASYDLYQDETWFLSTKWKKEPFIFDKVKTHKNLYAFYQIFPHVLGNDENCWWLTSFFKNDYEIMIFNFCLHGNGFDKTSLTDWKAFYQEMNNKYPELEQLGFKLNPEGAWYIPIASLNQETVIKNYKNSTLKDALTPITEALEKVKQAHPYFDQIVQAAIAKFGRIDVDEAV